MRAVVVDDPGGVDALRVVERDDLTPAAGEVLIDVVAAGVNRADLMQRQGFYPPPPGASDVLGLECSGVVSATGSDVTGFAPGDEVCALLAGGGYAEQVAAPTAQVARVPDGVDLVAAAGLMEVACTVWSNVVMAGRLTAGETLLVHGGASGIGTMAIQVATALGARVAVTVGSPEKAAVCRELGAELVIDYRQEDFGERLHDEDVRPDVILDIIGAKYLTANVKALATNGRLVIIGMQGGTKAELDLGALLRKRGTVAATSLRARPPAEKAGIVEATVTNVWPMIEAGSVRPIIHTTLALDDVAAAHQVLEESSHVGKVLLTT